MKILFFTEHLTAGGKERQIVELLKGLKSHSDVAVELVITKNEIHYEEVFTLGVPIHVIQRKFLKKDPRLFFQLFAIARKFKPDVIHVFGHMPAVYSLPTKWLLGIPMINNEIQDTSPSSKLLAKDFVFKCSDRIIGNSYMGLKAYHTPPEKSAVIYNGFSFERLRNITDRDEVRTRFTIKTRYVVGMVASFNHFKDYDTYIQAALSILSQRHDVTFLCIGNGDDSKYRKIVADKNQGNILFLGKQSQVESIMNICDIGVLSTFGEGISNALMEFMALGKPVVATDAGGTIELIDHTVSGFLVGLSNPDELALWITKLLDSESDRARVGKNAMERIRDKFGFDVMVEGFYSEYKNIMA